MDRSGGQSKEANKYNRKRLRCAVNPTNLASCSTKFMGLASRGFTPPRAQANVSVV